jgi:hypothetical protein
MCFPSVCVFSALHATSRVLATMNHGFFITHTQPNPVPYASHNTSRMGQPLGTTDYDFNAVFSSMHIWQQMASPNKRSVKDDIFLWHDHTEFRS